MNIDMARVKEMLTSPEWWLTAVVAAPLMSVIGAYLKQGMDRLLVASSKNWRDLRRWQKKQREDRIARASQEPYFLLSLVAREMRVRFRLVSYLIGYFGLNMFALGFVFARGGTDAWRWYERVANAFLLLWAAEWWTLRNARIEIHEAEQLRRQQHP